MLLRSNTDLQNVNHDNTEKRKQEISNNDEPVTKKMLISENSEKENIVLNFDYDRQEAHNFDAVSDFAMDIFKYYKSRETSFQVGDYMALHPNLCAKSRAILIDWLVELQETFEMNHETLYSAVKLVDIYLSRTRNVMKEEFQKIACAALFVSAKFDERRPPLIDDLAYLAGDKFNRHQLMEMERNLLTTVSFDVGAPLSYRYLRRLARVTRIDMCDLTLARYILETTLLVYDFCLISGCKMAAACFVLAMKMKSEEFVWNEVLTKYSGYAYDQIESLVPLINHYLHVITYSWKQLKNIRKKYTNPVFFSVANLPLLPDTISDENNTNTLEISFL